MKLRMKIYATVATLVCVTAAFAVDNEKKKPKLDKAQNTVDRIRQADSPQVQTSTGTTSAADIARRENAAEQQRQREASKRRKLDQGGVPSPTR